MKLDIKVVIGLAVVGLALFAFAPNLATAAVPLLLLAACPLSMILMMKMMSGDKGKEGDQAAPTTPAREAEIAELRAEVDRIRNESAGGGNGHRRQDAGPAAPPTSR